MSKKNSHIRGDMHFLLAFLVGFGIFPLAFLKAMTIYFPENPTPTYGEALCVGMLIVILFETTIIADRLLFLLVHFKLPVDEDDEP